MLKPSLLRPRIRRGSCLHDGLFSYRFYANGGNRKGPSKSTSRTQPTNGTVKSNDGEGDLTNGAAGDKELSLYEQLFPDQLEEDTKRQGQAEIPRLPIETVLPNRSFLPRFGDGTRGTFHDRKSRSSLETRQRMKEQDAQTSVLVLRNASKNLVVEDFKRLIPQGKHLEGWTLEEGDILQVIPGRDLETLAQQNFYYLLFSSPLSAFTYQGHATRIHRMVTAHTPSSILSSIPVPPGYMLAGMDAHSAIESFALTPPTQSLDLRQLKPPLPPMMESIVRNRGYAPLVKRKDRLPYEARLTLEGPQLHMDALKHVFLSSGKSRGLGWSGGDELAPRLSKWEPLTPRETPSPSNRSLDALANTQALERTYEATEEESSDSTKAEDQQQKRRTHQLVYIAGFHTESAMQSFVRHWNRRPLRLGNRQRNSIGEEELPPIAHVQVLW